MTFGETGCSWTLWSLHPMMGPMKNTLVSRHLAKPVYISRSLHSSAHLLPGFKLNNKTIFLVFFVQQLQIPLPSYNIYYKRFCLSLKDIIINSKYFIAYLANMQIKEISLTYCRIRKSILILIFNFYLLSTRESFFNNEHYK